MGSRFRCRFPSATLDRIGYLRSSNGLNFQSVDSHLLSMDEPPAASAESMNSFKWKLAFIPLRSKHMVIQYNDGHLVGDASTD